MTYSSLAQEIKCFPSLLNFNAVVAPSCPSNLPIIFPDAMSQTFIEFSFADPVAIKLPSGLYDKIVIIP